MPVMKQLVFIDDSGDPGFTKASSSNFVMAAALFMDQDVARRLSERILQFHEQLGWREEYEFKFTKIKIDGRSSKRNMQKTATYLRQEALRYNLRKLQIGFEDSSKNNLIQLADLIAGSINRSLTSKTDSKEYIEIIKEKIVSIKKIDK